MKTRIFALAVALAMPVSAQAATLTTPEYHTFTMHVDVANGSPAGCGCFAGGLDATISLLHLGVYISRTLSGSYNPELSPDWRPGDAPFYVWRTRGDGSSITFEVLDDTDAFSIVTFGHSGGARLSETISTPIPAALPLFAAGLGIISFALRRRCRQSPCRPRSQS